MNLEDFRNGGAHITAAHGERIATKLTAVQATEILRRCELRRSLIGEALLLSNPALAEKFELHPKSINRIISGARNNKHSGLILSCVGERNRLRALASLHSAPVMAAEFGVSESLIFQIGVGMRWVRLTTRTDCPANQDYSCSH